MMQLPEFLDRLRAADTSIEIHDIITGADQQIGA
jgi:hypothetical protein